jgi:WD40 repeat protein
MTELFKNEKDYVFPYVYEDFTRQGILVTKFIEGVKITPDGTKIVSYDTHYTIKVWDIRTREILLTLTGHTLSN